MEDSMKCIGRDKKTFKICERNNKLNCSFCRYHNKKNNYIYKIFYKIFGSKTNINMADIYNLYKYIADNINIINYEEDYPGHLFIELLKRIPYKLLLGLSNKYLENKKYTKSELYLYLYTINSKTNSITKTNSLQNMQNKYKYYLLDRNIDDTNIINSEDLFTCEEISNIPSNKLIIINDDNGGNYAFDIIELEYFTRKCKEDNKEPYNPYTRNTFTKETLWRINKKIEYNNLLIKNNLYNWDNDMRAFTDLSIEIERRGFYNSPEWFDKMSQIDILKTIKYFKDFSINIEESNKYYNDITQDNIVYEFCKDTIKMFRECNDDLYILCCNLIKSLAMCSIDFYENIPSWLSGSETTSLFSNIFSIFGNDFTNTSTGTNNFLLYYYVEYM